VRRTQVSTPVTSPDWQNTEFRNDDGGTDSSRDLLRSLDTKTNMTLRVSDNDDSLKSSSLTGTSLLLDWLDLNWTNISWVHSRESFSMHRGTLYLHDLIFQFWEKEVNNLVLLDGQRVKVDFLHALYLSCLDKTTKLGDWLPFFLLIL